MTHHPSQNSQGIPPDKPVPPGPTSATEALIACPHPEQLAADAELAPTLVTSPEGHVLASRVQEWDAALSKELRQVEIPSGLESRLLAAVLAQATLTEGAAHTEGTAPAPVNGLAEQTAIAPAAQAEATVPVRPVRRARRLWLQAAAAAVVLCGAVWSANHYWPRDEGPLDIHGVSQRALDWKLHQTVAVEVRSSKENPPPAKYPASIYVALPQLYQWGYVRNLQGFPHAVAYQWQTVSQRPVLLLVVRPSRQELQLPVFPHERPNVTTAGYAVGSWQEDGLVYVLIVQGNEDDFRQAMSHAGGIT